MHKGESMTQTVVFASGSDGTISQISEQTDKVRVETGNSFGKLRMLAGNKPRCLFAGSNQRAFPGSIRLFHFPSFASMQEIQVHGDYIARMELNFE